MKPRRPRDDGADVLSALLSSVRRLDLSSHSVQHVEETNARWIEAYVGEPELACVREQREGDEERGGRWIRRHANVRGENVLRRCELDRRSLAPELDTACLQHSFGVIAGEVWLVDARAYAAQ